MRMRALPALALTVVLALTAACGPDEKGRSVDPKAFASGLASAMREADTLHVELATKGPEEITVEGDVDLSSAHGPAMRLRTTESDTEAEIVLADYRIWLASPDLTDGLFYEIDTTFGSSIEQSFAEITDGVDPIQLLTLYGYAAEYIDVRGKPRTFEGVRTRRHHVVLDTSRLTSMPEIRAVPPEQRPPYLSLELYVGDDHLLRHVEMTIGPASMVADYTHFGQDVSVGPPPEDEITEVDPFAGFDDDV